MLHASTASLLTLPLSAPYITPEQQGDGTGTHSPPCFQPRNVTARLEGQTEPRLARRLVMSANTPSPARPRQRRGRRRLVPAGGYRTTRLGLLCAVTKSSSLSYRVTSTTGPLRVVLLLAVSNHSPAVWFIQAASEISVKCSA